MKKIAATGIMVWLFALPAYPIEFEGFASVGYHQHDAKGYHAEKSSASSEGFVLGGLDLYAYQQIGDDTSAFAEFIVGDFKDPVELERLWIKHRIAPSVEFKAGLIESPLGYWNRTYYHGGHLIQDSITRPFFLRYPDEEGAVFPVVSVGMELLGAILSHHGRLDYSLFLANGMSLDTGGGEGMSKIQTNIKGDPGEDKLVILRTSWGFSGVPLQIGVFGMSNPVAEGGMEGVVDTGSRLVSQGVVGADFHLSLGRLESFGEYYRISNTDSVGGSGTSSARAWYVHLGYQITERLKPLYRYSDLDLEETDPYFNYLGIEGQGRHVVGLRYDLDDSNALKLEFSRMEGEEGSKTHAQVQWAFMMF